MSELRVNKISNIDGSSTVEFATGVSGNAEGLRFEPKVVAFDPTNLAKDVDRNLTHINVTFDQTIQFSGVGTVRVRAGFATGTVYEEYTCGVSTNLLISGETLRINLTSGTLDGTTNYFVTLPSVGIANTYTQYYKGTENYVFTTKDATFNVDGGDYEQIIYNGSSPTNYYKYNIFTTSGIATFSAPSASAEHFSYMLIGGGGGGGGGPTSGDGWGGGGGAGGLLKNYNSAGFVAGELTVTIGSYGNGTYSASPTDSSYPFNHPQRPHWWAWAEPGSDSSIGPTPVGTITAYGGGAAGHGMHNQGTPQTPNVIPDHHGKPGGSGGGGSKARPYPQGSNPSEAIPSQPYRPGGDALGYPGPAQQGYPGGFTYNYPYPYNDQSRGSGGGGGAGQAGQPEVRYNPHHSPNRYNLPGTACQGGDGTPNPEFNSSVLSYINGIPSALYQAAGPQGYFAGGGGGGVHAFSSKYPTNPNSPSSFTPTTTGQGGEGGGGRGHWLGSPPNPFATTPQVWAEKGINGMGGGGGGGSMGPSSSYPNPQYPNNQSIDPTYAPPTWAPYRPQWILNGAPGGSGGFYIRYAHPGSV